MSGVDTLRQKLEKLKQESTVDRTAVIEEWLRAIDGLLARFTKVLEPYVRDGLVVVHTGVEMLREDALGDYGVRSMSFEIGPRKIFLTPVGRYIVGAQGRVDLYAVGARASAHMLLRTKGRDWVIRPPGPPTPPRPLTDDEIRTVIERLVE